MSFLHPNHDLKTTLQFKTSFAQLSLISKLASATYGENHIHFSGASIFPETLKVKIQDCVVDEKIIINIVRALWIAHFLH